MDGEPSQDLTTRVLILYDEDAGAPDWVAELRHALSRFGLELGVRSRSAVASIPSLLRGHRFCVFVLVENPSHDSQVRAEWQRTFDQIAADTQLLRLVSDHAHGDVIADAVLSDVERIAARLRRQRAATVSPAAGALSVGYDMDE